MPPADFREYRHLGKYGLRKVIKNKKMKKLYALADLIGYFLENLKKGESIIKIFVGLIKFCLVLFFLYCAGKESWFPAAFFTTVDWRDVLKSVLNKDSG